MNWLIILFACGIWLGKSEEEVAAEFIAEVDSKNIQDLVATHHSSVVLFYAPWCGHCKKLMGEYDVMCKDVQDTFSNKVLCGRLDCTKNDDLCQGHGLRGYPTIKMLRGDYVCEFKGPRTRSAIFNWIKSLYYGTADVNDIQKIDEIVKSSEYTIVGYFEPDHADRKLIETVACQLDTVNFATLSNQGVAKHLNIDKINTFNIIKDGVFVKSLENVKNQSTLSSLVFFNVNPLVADFNVDAVSKIFSEEVNYYLAYVYDTEESLTTNKHLLHSYAENNVPNIRVFTVNSTDIKNSNIVNYFHITKFPSVIFYYDTTQNFYHYQQESLNFQSLVDFTTGCLNGSIPNFVKKEPVPEDWDKKNVKLLVTDNFEEVFKLHPMGIVLFHAPWCGHCQALMSVWDELGDLVKSKYPDIFVAKVDHTANDIPNVNVVGYPTIVAFRSLEEKFYHDGDRDIASLEKFIISKLVDEEPPTEPEKEQPEREDL